MTRGDFDVVLEGGAYRVCKSGRRRDRTHHRFAAAEAAALRLVAAYPDETFIITREIARVQQNRK